ncbi:MAG: hypothetical protein JWM65_1549 [Sphingomonas bacterium]|nr:hypothetical protein [Sphingomonas bacterium]
MSANTCTTSQAVALELTRLILDGQKDHAGDKDPFKKDNVLAIFKECYAAAHFTPSN